MWRMVVTLDVSKLSDWLNLCAICRESKGGHMVRGELPSRMAGHAMRCDVQAGRREGVGLRRRKRHARAEGPTQGGQRVERT